MRKFYRDEENPYDSVQKSTESVFRNEEKLPEESIEPTGKIIKNIDDPTRRVSGETLIANGKVRINEDGMAAMDTDLQTQVALVSTAGAFVGKSANLSENIVVSTSGSNGVLADWTPASDLGGDMGTSSKKWDDIWCDELHYNTLTAISDQKVKEKVEVLKRGLADLNKLQTKKYIRTENQNQEYGLIAQEVQVVMPEVVKVFEQDNGEQLLGIDMSAIIAVMINAIQEIDRKIEANNK